MAPTTVHTALILLVLFFCSCSSSAQQLYTGNDMLDCYAKPNTTSVRGYVCGDAAGGSGGASSCLSYLLFRSAASYDTPVGIAYLLGANAQNISSLNGLTDIAQLPTDRPVFVPVTCSCSGPFPNGSARYYQYNASYTLKWDNETYMIVSNITYQGLTTCQAMMAQNPLYDSYNLSVGETLKAPLRCACPTRDQIAAGYRYLLTYLVTWDDDITSIASRFRCDPAVLAKINGLSTAKSTIFPYTTLLVPLKEQPTSDLFPAAAPPPAVPIPPNASPPTGSGGGSRKGKKQVAIGIGMGIAVFAILLCSFILWRRTRQRQLMRIRRMEPHKSASGSGGSGGVLKAERDGGNQSSSLESYSAAESGYTSTYGSSLFNSSSTPSTIGVSEEARLLAAGALVAYKYWDLQKATGFFSESHRISGSVYRGVINGDTAAVKRMKGDVSGEVAILKRFNHSSLIRLSGFCVHSGNTYLVFQYAEGGSLSDRLHYGGDKPPLTWKQRVQIAYDVADGLNYLHNYASPACVHKDLRSSNVLLDGEFRAKLSNFGLARSLPEDDGGAPQMTRHVVGTQGYMPPEYLEHGLISPKMDIFALGVVLLELLSGRDAVTEAGRDPGGGKKGSVSLLWEEIAPLMAAAEDIKERLTGFIDQRLRRDQYPFDAAFAMVQLARRCVARDPAARPNTEEVLKPLAALYSTTLNWDPSSVESNGQDSMVYPR